MSYRTYARPTGISYLVGSPLKDARVVKLKEPQEIESRTGVERDNYQHATHTYIYRSPTLYLPFLHRTHLYSSMVLRPSFYGKCTSYYLIIFNIFFIPYSFHSSSVSHTLRNRIEGRSPPQRPDINIPLSSFRAELSIEL